MTEESQTDKIIFASRKSVFKVTLVHFTLTLLIIVSGIIMALLIDDILGALIIVILASLNTALMALAMFLQTKPLQIHMDRLKALKEDD